MPDVAMPRLSDSMEEGTILKWLKSDGDEVARGEELVEIETDKANMTYEADQGGTLSIVAQEGDTLPVGDTIARIGEGAGSDGAAESQTDAGATAEQTDADATAEQSGPDAGESQSDAGATAEQTDQESQASGGEREPGRGAEDAAVSAEAEQERETARTNGAGDGERVKASPIARRMAREMNVELSGLQGSGPGGRIVKADVEAAAKGGAAATAETPAAGTAEPAAQPSAPAEERQAGDGQPEAPGRAVPAAVVSGEKDAGRGEVSTQDLTRLQQTIARRMAESKATAPEFVLNTEVDMEAAVELRKQLKVAAQDGGAPAPSFNDFVIKACALALRDFPRANGAYRDGKFELYGRVNVGVAVAGQDALVVPTVFDADRKSLGQIAREARDLAERVRAGAITPPELSSGTFSVSNLGMYGISSFTAVINPPQAAILAVGAMEPKPVAADGEVQVRHRMTITLSCDHRILYGADAAEFLARIRQRLEQPLLLAL